MPNECYNHAVLLLSQREHSALELMKKLAKKGYNSTDVRHAIEQCRQQGYQSDTRFAEMMLRVQANKGYGPIRIQQALLATGVERSLITACFDACDYDWAERAVMAWQKKYGKGNKKIAEVTQKRFLFYRGFELSQISHALRLARRVE